MKGGGAVRDKTVNKIYTKVVYYDVDTGEELDQSFKEQFYYEFKEVTIIKNRNYVNTTRGVKLIRRKPKQQSLF